MGRLGVLLEDPATAQQMGAIAENCMAEGLSCSAASQALGRLHFARRPSTIGRHAHGGGEPARHRWSRRSSTSDPGPVQPE